MDRIIPNVSLDGHDVDTQTDAERQAAIERSAEKEPVA
jgi:hypothetical protein